MFKEMLIGAAIAGAVLAGVCAQDPPLMEVRRTIRSGETIWDVCAGAVSERDNLQEVVFRTMEENHIENPGEIQPGQVVVIRVKGGENFESQY